MNARSYHVRNGHLYYGDWKLHKLTDLTRNASCPFPNNRHRQWRYCAHNLVVHPLFGDCITVATDGVHVVVDIGDAQSGEVAKESLLGPVDRNVTHPLDWDWDNNKRRVHVFKRGNDQPPVIIPFNTWMDNYWARFSKLSPQEHQAYMAISRHGVDPTHFDEILEQLNTKAQQAAAAPSKEKQARDAAIAAKVALLLEDL